MAYLIVPKSEAEVKKLTIANLRKEYLNMANFYNKLANLNYKHCDKCNDWLSTADNNQTFYKSKEYASGYFPICKKCLAEMACDYDKKTNTYVDNREKTIEVLRMMNLPFDEKLYKSSLNTVYNELGEKVRGTAWKQMMTMLASLPQYRGKTFKDSFFDGQMVDSGDDRTPRPEIIKLFGSGFSNDDYLYLQDQYDDWKLRTQVDTKSQETYIVRICFKLLDIWKAQRVGKDTKDLDKSLNDLMAAAALQPKQSIKDTQTSDLTFGQLIERWEEEEPIPEPSEEFKDVDGIGKYIRVWFAGHLAKALGLNNAYSSEYEEELKKYTVEVSSGDISGDNNSDTIYDKLFGSVGE